MRHIALLSAVALLFVTGCGGGGSSTITGNNNTSSPMSATIDGTPWATPVPQVVYASNILSVAGIDLGITASVGFASVVSGTGTYSLSYGNQGAASGTVTRASQGWTSGLPGGTGTLTLTTLTAHHVVGTFSFNAVPGSGGATGTVHVTDGKFDITF